jgi:hypothetical protein
MTYKEKIVLCLKRPYVVLFWYLYKYCLVPQASLRRAVLVSFISLASLAERMHLLLSFTASAVELFFFVEREKGEKPWPRLHPWCVTREVC